MKISYRCRDCEHYNYDCENNGKQRLGGSQICKYFKLRVETTDVVEREKIDKAIKDLKEEYCCCELTCIECLKIELPYSCTCSIPLHEVIEFFNGNIGE